MISVDQAEHIILSEINDYGTEFVNLSESSGRVTASDWLADTDFPPFHRVMMDGICIRYKDFERGQRTFISTGVQRAGENVKKLDADNTCFEIMTGAVLSEGADTVIPYEECTRDGDHFSITTERVFGGQHIHLRGSDGKKGEIVLTKGRRISAAEIGIAASLGMLEIKVRKTPKVILISTGDELVPVDTTPLPYQIRRSNIYSIQAVLNQFQITADITHLPDQRDILTSSLQSVLSSYDIIIMSGGVSKGKFDLIPGVMTSLGVTLLFHEIAQRPGKPFLMGKQGHRLVFAFPGNPVSTFLCVQRYLVPWLRQVALLQPAQQEYAELMEDFKYKKTLTQFLQVNLQLNTVGRLCAYPKPSKGSGDLIHLAATDAFLELPADGETGIAGHHYKIFRYRS